MEKYSLGDAQNEAELLKEKISSGEAFSYQEANNLIENKRLLSSIRDSLEKHLHIIQNAKDIDASRISAVLQDCQSICIELEEIGKNRLVSKIEVELIPQLTLFNIPFQISKLSDEVTKRDVDRYTENCLHSYRRIYLYLTGYEQRNLVFLKSLAKFLGETFVVAVGTVDPPVEYFEFLGDNARVDEVNQFYRKFYKGNKYDFDSRIKYIDKHITEIVKNLKEIAKNFEEELIHNFGTHDIEQTFKKVMTEFDKEIENPSAS